jgi:hypothetical protein
MMPYEMINIIKQNFPECLENSIIYIDDNGNSHPVDFVHVDEAGNLILSNNFCFRKMSAEKRELPNFF